VYFLIRLLTPTRIMIQFAENRIQGIFLLQRLLFPTIRAQVGRDGERLGKVKRKKAKLALAMPNDFAGLGSANVDLDHKFSIVKVPLLVLSKVDPGGSFVFFFFLKELQTLFITDQMDETAIADVGVLRLTFTLGTCADNPIILGTFLFLLLLALGVQNRSVVAKFAEIRIDQWK
jgi:hypothetical protein